MLFGINVKNKCAHKKYLTFQSYLSFDVYENSWETIFRQCFVLHSQETEPEANVYANIYQRL